MPGGAWAASPARSQPPEVHGRRARLNCYGWLSHSMRDNTPPMSRRARGRRRWLRCLASGRRKERGVTQVAQQIFGDMAEQTTFNLARFVTADLPSDDHLKLHVSGDFRNLLRGG